MVFKYDLDKIKFGTDGATFERAIGLYASGKVKDFKAADDGFSAFVLGSKPYRVFVSARQYDSGTCECYLGQNNTLCKHMVAVAIRAVAKGKPLSDSDKRRIDRATCSGWLGMLSEAKLAEVKKEATDTLRYIKSYTGPSRTWFAYQDSLSEGCSRLSALVSDLPASPQTAAFLVDILLRLERKLAHTVDDSDGTVGGCIETIVEMLQEFARLDPACVNAFAALKNRNTSFGWEEPLVTLIK